MGGESSIQLLLVLGFATTPPGSFATGHDPSPFLSGHPDTHHIPAPDHDAIDTHQMLHSRSSSTPPTPLPFQGAVPAPFAVKLSNDSLLLRYMNQNIDYLLRSFDVDHMLYPFRVRAGKVPPPRSNSSTSREQIGFWDTDLKGSNAGRFLMGAGNTLRWIENEKLRVMLNAVVDGIDDCKDVSASGSIYILPYHPAGFMHSEQGDYGRSWLTQGMIEAGKAGNRKVWPLLRGMYDWFNNPATNPYLPYLYDGIGNAEQGQIPSTRMYLETPIGVYADSQAAQDTYRDDVWMRQLMSRDPTGVYNYHMPSPNHPHCYEITSFLSMFDNYRATHNATWLAAAEGAFDILLESFVNVDGTSSLTEGRRYTDPKTGELTDWRVKPAARLVLECDCGH